MKKTIEKTKLDEALKFVRAEADSKRLLAQAARYSNRESDAQYYDGVSQGMQMAALAIESRYW